MVETTAVVVTTVSALLQLGAAYCSYVIYKYNRVKKGWLSITGAMILMAASSVFGLVIQGSSMAQNPAILSLYSIWLPVLIALFMYMGIESMMKSFESFDVVEKQVGDKASEFFKSTPKPSRKAGKK